MKFEKFIYLYPPRPETSVQFGSKAFNGFKKPGWKAQYKLNGQRNLIFIEPDGNIQLWNRHREKHRNFKCPGWLIEEIQSQMHVERGKWTVIDGELLHAKHASVKNTMYLWDVLVLNGEYLINTTYADRYKMLSDVLDVNGQNDFANVISDHIWFARNIEPEMWDSAWEKTSVPIIEGFVLKNTLARLAPGFSSRNNSSWMVRCRLETKNYKF